MVLNEMQRAALYPSQNYVQDATEKITNKLLNNGYSEQWIHSCTTKKKKKKKGTNNKQSLFTLKVPFISDNINNCIKRIITKHKIPVRLVNSKCATLRDIIKRPATHEQRACHSKNCPAPGICNRSFTVYRASCQLCHQLYIGMTTRRLHDRAREHITAAKNGMKASAFGEHYKEEHPYRS